MRWLLALGSLWLTGGFAAERTFPAAPGVVVAHSPKASGIYLGSPSIAILPDRSYVVSHDQFGPKSNEFAAPVTRIFRSSDQGELWEGIAELHGAFWSTLFVHRGRLYLIGTNTHHGCLLIRASDDGGHTWTIPSGRESGLLRDDGQYHCAPVPVIEHAGRIWRAVERREPMIGWGITYRASVISAPVDSDLLNGANWTLAEPLPGNRNWLGGTFGGWLEGNVVPDRTGNISLLLRVVSDHPEKAALLQVDSAGKKITFNPTDGFVAFAGGAKKFTIRFDGPSNRYWALANVIQPQDLAAGRPGALRNTLALVTSRDLREWEVRRVVVHHSDVKHHGFQYADWTFDGNDLVAAVRTAADDGEGGAENFHDANFITFHRIAKFRE